MLMVSAGEFIRLDHGGGVSGTNLMQLQFFYRDEPCADGQLR